MYPIVRVPEPGEGFTSEQLGSKPKHWYDSGRRLFKAVTREDSGEDWAEKVCGEVAAIIGLPHAHYELAESSGCRGVVSVNFRVGTESLMLGNEVLRELDPAYGHSNSSKFRASAHTVQRVLDALETKHPALPRGWTPPWEGFQAGEVFCGYLMLDALVGNTDRHDENWGLIRSDAGLWLAPTFDHASSLGCHEKDIKRTSRLLSRDANYSVAAFARRARSALYMSEADRNPLFAIDAFAECSKRFPSASSHWLSALQSVDDRDLAILMDEVPSERISDPARRFAKEMMRANRAALLLLSGASK